QGTWTLSGGGVGVETPSSNTYVFTPGATPGCFSVTYSAVGCTTTVNFLIFPETPTPSQPANTCNSPLALPTIPNYAGFGVQYSVDGGAYTASPIVPSTPGCHTFQLRYVNTADCGTSMGNSPSANPECGPTTAVSAVIFPAAPVITAPAATCASMFVLPSVPAVDGF